jgi:hypothetical protein
MLCSHRYTGVIIAKSKSASATVCGCAFFVDQKWGLQTTDNGLHHASLNLGSNQFCTPQLSRWENPLNLPFRDACR